MTGSDDTELTRYIEDFSRQLTDAAAAQRTARPWRRAVDALRRPMTGRGLAIGLAALVLTGSAMAATVRLTAEAPPSYDVDQYLHHGDAYDCDEFRSQAFAQAVLRANPSDPNHLDDEQDDDRDGVACPQLPAPRDLTPVPAIAGLRCGPTDRRTARCPQAWRPFHAGNYVHYLGSDAYDCKQFASRADAQAVLRFSPTDPNRLDGDGDGIACPRLPAPKDLTPAPRQPAP